MKLALRLSAVACTVAVVPACTGTASDDFSSLGQDLGSKTVHVWVSTGDHRLTEKSPLHFGTPPPRKTVIQIDDSQLKQSVVGFGASMTDSSAWLLTHGLSSSRRDKAMHDLFDRDSGIGLSVLRQPIGASDFTVDGRYSYDDVPGGDPSLSRFSIDHDLPYIIPRLREAIAIEPDMWIVMTPWSPPGWMKTNDSMLNPGDTGKLRGSAYGPFAHYLVKSINSYHAQGIHISALTPQNEPTQGTGGYPGMDFDEGAEASLIAKFLAKDLHDSGLEGSVELLGYDYNWPWRSDVATSFPEELLAGEAAAHLGGLAFHCYGGDPSTMTTIHDQHPDKDVFVTECTSGATVGGHGEAIEQLIMAMRNWARTFVTWNLALHPDGSPHQGSGCNGCIGVMSIEGGQASPTRDYAQLGHASKFVRRGAHVVESAPSRRFGNHQDDGIPVEDVAFVNPDGTHVVVVYDWTGSGVDLQISFGGMAFDYALGAREAVTFTW